MGAPFFGKVPAYGTKHPRHSMKLCRGVPRCIQGAALALQNAAGGEIVLDVIAGVQTADLHPVLGVEAWTMLPSPMYRPTWVG